MSDRYNGLEIAIIGMDCRFPGARNLDEYWHNLSNGVESIRDVTTEEALAEGADPAMLQKDNYVGRASVLEDVEKFDAAYFDYNPREAEMLDPQHRLFLEGAVRALEDAGYYDDRMKGQVGVFAGCSMSTYLLHNLYSNQAVIDSYGRFQTLIANDKDYLATRVSYKLNLRGPSMTVLTACSTSLVAVHTACQSLLNGDCDMALAGGSSIRFPQKVGYLFEEGSILSPDGHCRSFDRQAQGTVAGNGVGVIVLKRLEDALRDGDDIHAVIKGSAVNNDGTLKIGYTAPSVQGQSQVIRAAHHMADVPVESITYVEAHGTATVLGDPIEVTALTQAFRKQTDETAFCAIGSVKSNIGHLDTAAGVAGLIKTVLALKHKQIPPSLHHVEANPNIDFASSPFFVNTELRAWTSDGDTPRRAGVSSFGIGGTNAHVVLEEAPQPETSRYNRSQHLLLLSAKTSTALETMTDQLADHLEAHPDLPLGDVEYTLKFGRKQLEHRRFLLINDRQEAVRVLRNRPHNQIFSYRQKGKRSVAFLFPGQGSQYPKMAEALYRTERVFRDTVDEVCALLQPHLSLDLRTLLFPSGETAEASERLSQTLYTQPALFVIEYALAKLWMAWGVQPSAMIGHSIGEYVAATLAGVFALEDTVKIVAARGRLIQSLPQGSMLTVQLPEAEVVGLIDPSLSIAAVNHQGMTVVSGADETIEAFAQKLQAAGVECRKLVTSHAFHSSMMEPILEAFSAVVSGVPRQEPKLPFISNLTGAWITAEQATDPAYWVRHLRETVRFADGVQVLFEDPERVLLEVGPRETLSTLVKQHPNKPTQQLVFSSLGRPKADVSEATHLLTVLGQLWLGGVEVNWKQYHKADEGRRVHLPPYPFEGKRFWIEPRVISYWGTEVNTAHAQHEQEVAAAEEAVHFHERPNLMTAYVAPADEVEQGICETLQWLLGLEQIGVEDDFFDLGGHSLLATQVVSRLREKFNVDLTLKEFFAVPTVRGMAERVKAAVQERAEVTSVAFPLQRMERGNIVPVSFAQQRLWFLDQLNPGNTTYNEPLGLRITGAIDVQAIQQSLNELMQRHDILRTRIVTVDGKPMQVIEEHMELEVAYFDLRETAEAERDEAVRQLVQQASHVAFDLSTGPLIRATLVQVDEQEHVLLVVVHHIIFDGWSSSVFVREWVQLYRALAEGTQPQLPELPVQYADYAICQREWLRDEVLDKQVAYWKEHLAGVPELLNLPTDRARPAVQTYRGAKCAVELSEELVQGLKALAQEESSTLFMILLAAFQTLLYRYTDQSDVCVGSPIANRTHSDLEHLIGLFVNTLVYRADFAQVKTFRELLRQVRTNALSAYDHQDIPFERLVDELQPERNLSYHPLFQVVFVLQNMPLSKLELPGLTFEEFMIEEMTSKFDLTMRLAETGQQVKGIIEYNRDLFDESTIQRFINHYQQLITDVLAHPDRNLLEVELLSQAERHLLLNEFVGGALTAEVSTTLGRRFEEQVVLHPDAVAVVCDGATLTYRELNEQANQLAHALQARGVGRGTYVGLAMERSLSLIVGVLGIVKAGGAYVPLDPTAPKDRLAFTMEDAAIQCLVTESHLLDELPACACHVFCFDRDAHELSTYSSANLAVSVDPLDPAYVIYTSGSTGKPKGVIVAHQNVVRLFASTEQWYGFDEQDVWTMFHSFAFDFSVWEIWGALLYGGKLVVVPYLVSRAPEAFYQLLVEQKVTVLNQTPSAFYQLMRAEEDLEADPNALSLRYVIFGGEALEYQSLQGWFDRHGDQMPQLVNMYGITETTVHVTYRPVSRADLNSGARSAIGVPIPDLEVYVLNEALQPMPIGVPGEMYVGGAGLAIGYLNRPELTAERFIPHPFRTENRTEQGLRLYKTGDLACYRADGTLDYFGRIDHQVKIRGFRIELGEIESLLAEHPRVQQAHVLVREDVPGDKQLVSYLVAKQEAVTGGELRNWLGERLPTYMIPSAFVWLENIPITSNGKVDRKALPTPTFDRAAMDTEYLAPRNEVEAALCAVFAEVLGLEQVGVLDNFFSLGGDSIRSIQVLSEAKARDLHMTLQQLFQLQTVAEIAQAIQSTTSSTEQMTAPFELVSEKDRALLPDGLSDAYPVTQLQAGMLFHSELHPESAVYHDIFSYHLGVQLDENELLAALQTLTKRHDMLRTSFDFTTYAEPLQLVHREVEVPLVIDDISDLEHEQQEQMLDAWIEQEKTNHFDLQSVNLIRFYVHRRSQESFQLTFSFHHAMLDGWSVASLMTELMQGYLARLHGTEGEEPVAVTSSYREFVRLERLAMDDPAQRDFWLQKLSDFQATVLPRYGTRAAKEEHGANEPQQQVFAVPMSDDTTQALQQVARQAGVTLKHVLLAAHLYVLRVVTGQDDVTTGLVMNGRPETGDGERVTGLFLNTVPYRMQIGEGSWQQLIQRTFEEESELLPYRRYPLAHLQQMLGTQQLFETAFNYIHFHVYGGVSQLEGVQYLGGKFFQETNFTFTANFALDVTAGLLLELYYDAERFDAEQMGTIASYYQRVLTGIAQAPQADRQVTTLLDAQELAQLQAFGQGAQTPVPMRTAHELFEAQVERTPDRLAVEGFGTSFTYRELNELANRLAHRLQRQGIGPEQKVGLLLPRSHEFVISLLAIWKAGGAYVPLDPTYPQERLRYMMQDAGLQLLVTTSELFQRMEVVEGIPALVLDDAAEAIAVESSENLEPHSDVNALAYVIYTSGSTGLPKGVLLTHGGIGNLAQAQIETFGVISTSRVLQSASLSFDASVSEMVMALFAGACLVVADREQLTPGPALLKTLRETKTSVVTLPPSVLALLEADELPDLQTVISAGEACPIEVASKWQQGRRFFNAYGPTENTVCTTIFDMNEFAGTSTLPIGRPIANTRVYVLNAQKQHVPIGTPGELYVSSPGLAWGYLNQPEKTADHFVLNPHGEAGERMYRTGDLVRWLPSGVLEYFGRVDNQVKIRGFRIELSEVEEVLLATPGIQVAHVIVREDRPGDKRLVAYLVSKGAAQDVAEIRAHLRAKLPDYLVPSHLLFLDALPMTPNGKIDRKQLPSPKEAQPRTTAYAAPTTDVEAKIIAIWQDVLQIDRIGNNDTFFDDLGGHSLLALQVVARMKEVFGRDLPITSLFTYPTPKQMAQYLMNQQAPDTEARQEKRQERVEQKTQQAKKQRELRQSRREQRR